ncbi:hypothetical protein IAT38_000147 [Cryptococcus sp. DSM 104549]
MALAAQPTTYLSSASADALISDLRPTTLSPLALTHLNTLLDELLISLLSSAQSLNPFDLRREAVPSVFSGEKGLAGDSTGTRALGRSAVAEAEVELRSWHEGRAGGRGFPPDGKGAGTRSERAFPLMQAVELMRLKCVAFSTLAPQDAQDEAAEAEALAAWKKVGGDVSEETVEPSGLWITAIIEHVCEHILSQLSRVVARDAGMAVAGPQDLYTALCEDESVWGLFRKMRVKEQLETAIRSSTKPKRGTPSRSSPDSRSVGRASPAMSTTSRDGSRTTLPRDTTSFDTARGMSPGLERAGVETNHMGGIAGGIIRKGSTLSRKSPHGGSPAGKHLNQQHERTGSVLSVNTRSMLGAFDASHEEEEEDDGQSPQEAQDEFDALVRSGQTMKVSLTPSRLKNFELTVEQGRKKQLEGQSPVEQVAPRSRPSSSKSDGRRSMSITRVPVPKDAPPVSDAGSGITVTTTTATMSSPARAPSAPSGASTSPSVRPAANMRRTESAQKRLIARGATTIEELQDEEDDLERPAARPQKKESIFDILADEESFGPLPKEPKQSPGKRTVPAVVLGTPPPPGPMPSIPLPSPPKHKPSPILIVPPPSQAQTQLQPQPNPSVNRPFRSREGSYSTSASGEDDPAPAARRKRTEAQELADFFNSEPPPEEIATARGRAGEDEPPTTAKSRGFRGFMSKVTGSGSKKKEEHGRSASHDVRAGALTSASHSRLNSASGTPVSTVGKSAGGSFFDGGMKRQKSFQSLASGQTGYKGYESEPPLPIMPLHVQSQQQQVPSHQQYQQQQPSHPPVHQQHQRQAVPLVPQKEIPRKPTPPTHTPTPPPIVAPIPVPPPVAAAAPAAVASPSPEVSPPAPVQKERNVLRKPSSSASLRRPSPPQSQAGSARDTAAARETAAAAAAATSALAGVAGAVGLGKVLGGEAGGEGKGKKDVGVITEEPAEVEPKGVGEKAPPKETVPQQKPKDKSALQQAAAVVTANAGTSTPARSASGPKSPIEASPSDAVSFKTADEGSEAEAEVETGPLKGVEDDVSTKAVEDGVAESEAATSVPSPNAPGVDSPATTPKEAVSHTSAPAEPSILLKDLAPLRNLLDHATSARECRLLLSAILTQYGVPQISASSETAESGVAGLEGQGAVKPEDRVLAWLLAGREGPVGDVHLAKGEVEVEEEEGEGGSREDQVVTPTQGEHSPSPLGEPIQLKNKHSSSTAPASVVSKADRADLLSQTGLTDPEPSSTTTTEFSTDGETTEGEGEAEVMGAGVGYAKVGERGSPVRIVRREREVGAY